jgi:hypothetical protein
MYAYGVRANDQTTKQTDRQSSEQMRKRTDEKETDHRDRSERNEKRTRKTPHTAVWLSALFTGAAAAVSVVN